MAADPEAKFLKQARRGLPSWRMQYHVAFALTGTFLAFAAYFLWESWAAGATGDGIMPILVCLSLAVAAGMWAIHSELMQGAALYVARTEAP